MRHCDGYLGSYHEPILFDGHLIRPEELDEDHDSQSLPDECPHCAAPTESSSTTSICFVCHKDFFEPTIVERIQIEQIEILMLVDMYRAIRNGP
jgi:hypothetical protein